MKERREEGKEKKEKRLQTRTNLTLAVYEIYIKTSDGLHGDPRIGVTQ